MNDICTGRVAIVTGGGRGLGRAHALELARQGAKVVVNDLGSELDGTGVSSGPAREVVETIRASGGEAVVNGDDISDWDGAGRVVNTAIETFGGLDILVNNAGIVRDRMLFNMSIDEWDAVIRVHMRGTFAPTRWAAEYWRTRAKEGKSNDARVINTSAPAGLFGGVGQSNYGSAKAAIAAFTLIAAKELARYGVTANAISPGAQTRMTGPGLPPAAVGAGGFDDMAAENVSPLVAWLASSESAGVTGRVFNVSGGMINVAEGWRPGPRVDKGARWDAAELGGVLTELVARAAPPVDIAEVLAH
ncbi:SDR family oxidoreductase [Nocardioides sp.]|uniref:SDR family oxidoreductase n=1 Tax=Nocardioides sp. TaxID=35761 RepID=UPI003D0C5190